MSSNTSDESDYVETKPRRVSEYCVFSESDYHFLISLQVLKARPRKRVKLSESRPKTFEFPLQSLLSVLHAQRSDEDSDTDDFQLLLDPFLVEFLQSRALWENSSVEINDEVSFYITCSKFAH